MAETLGIGFATQQFWRAIQRHRKLFLACFAAVLALGLITLFILKPSYTATAVVAIAPQATDPLAPSGQQTADQFEDDDLPETIAAMMQARGVAAAVLAQNPTASIPVSRLKRMVCTATLSLLCSRAAPADSAQAQQAQIDRFLRTLSVTPETHSHVIDVSVTADTAARAAALADSVVQNYQRLALDQQIGQSNGTSDWLASRTAELQQRWLSAVNRATAYSVQHGLTATNGNPSAQSLVDRQMGDLAASLALANSRLATAQAEADTLPGGVVQGDGTNVPDQGDGTASGELLQLENQRDLMAGEFGPNYPRLQALDHEIAAAQHKPHSGARSSNPHAVLSQNAAVARAEVKALTAQLNQLQAQAVAETTEQATYQGLQAEAANAHADYATFLQHADEVADRATLLKPPVTLVSNAGIPTRPSFPNIPKLFIGILFLALVAGAAAVLLADYFSKGFDAAEELRAFVDVPLLASIPVVLGGAGRAIANHVIDAPFSRASEAVRGLAASLSLLASNRNRPRCVLITSAGAFEGKSTLALWLAMTVRKSGEAVLLIDGDHRRGKLLQGSATPYPGLTDLLAGEAMSHEVIQHDEKTKIDFISGGTLPARPYGSEEITQLQEIIAGFKKSYNMIVIDSPPLMAMADGLVFGAVADQTIFVCRWQQTSRGAVRASLDRLRTYGVNVAGIVVSMVDQHAALNFDGQYSKREYELMTRLYGS